MQIIAFIIDQLEVAKILKHIREQTLHDLSTPYFLSLNAGFLTLQGFQILKKNSSNKAWV